MHACMPNPPHNAHRNRSTSRLIHPSDDMVKQSSCCHKKRLKRGLWSPEEDDKLMNHIAKYGHGCWSSVPKLAGLERCGKSCRLRWINYLRPDLKRGTFSQEEEDLIIHLHSMLGNKWSQIAAQLPGRTDNEVKNFWNSYIKKKLRERGIDPATHKPLAAPAPTSSTSTSTACRAVFSDAELIPTTMPVQAVDQMLDGLKMPLDWPLSGNGMLSECYQVPTLQMQAFDMDAPLQHCGGIPVVPSASSSSTLTSMAGLSPAAADAEQCAHLPWLELGAHNTAPGHHHLDHYAGALDELRWSDYFDGAFQAAATTSQCLYDGTKVVDNHDAAAQMQFDDHGLTNWC